ncbi:hypothetical protein GCM10022221_15200 [Actinocorallia aurea]
MTTIERGGPRGRRGTGPARREEAPAAARPETGKAPAEDAASRPVPARKAAEAAGAAGRTTRKATRKADKTSVETADQTVKTGTADKAGKTGRVSRAERKGAAKGATTTVADPAPGRAAPRRRAPVRDPRPARPGPGPDKPGEPDRPSKPSKAPEKAPRPRSTRPKAPARDGRPRAPFVLLVLCLMGGALVGLLVLNTVLARDSFTLSALQKSERQLIQDKQQLVEDIAREEAPERLAAKAENEGMVQPEQLAFVDPVDGTVTGGKKRPVPSAAAAAAAAAGVIGVPGAIVPGDGIPGYTGTQQGVPTDPAAAGER